MVIYNCPRCGFETNRKNDLLRHFNKKNTCNCVLKNINIETCKEMLNDNKSILIKLNNSVHTCPRCYYESKNKSNIRVHLTKNKPCEITYKDVTRDECLNLLEKGYLKNYLKKEENNNTVSNDNEIKQRLTNLELENERLKEKINRLENKIESLKPSSSEFIYLLQEREFIRSKENVYKIGRTINPKSRINNYPKDSKLIHLQTVKDNVETEKLVIRKFHENFIHRADIGKEYFEGDHNVMSNLIKQYN